LQLGAVRKAESRLCEERSDKAIHATAIVGRRFDGFAALARRDNKTRGLMNASENRPAWTRAAVLIARLIFAAMFAMAVSFKLMDINATASFIAAAGFPMSIPLAWLAALFELALVACFLTGAYFSEAALLAAVYVLFLAFAFHGPSHWAANKDEFGFFVDHFTFFAGLLFAAAHGPGQALALDRRWIRR
jgi:putative oxidoreductase